MALTGAQRVALILSTIEPNSAGKILRHLSEEVVTRIGRQMVGLNSDAISKEEIDTTVKKFVRDFKNYVGPSMDPGLLFDRIVRSSYGDEDAELIMKRVQAEALPGVRALEEIDPKQIAAVLTDDHPQVVALVLSRMSPGPAAKVLEHLPVDRKPDVCRRLASMPRPSPELVRRVIGAVMAKVFRASTSGSASGTTEGVRSVAVILKSLGPETSKDLVGRIAADNGEMARAIQLQMFTFEDLKMLSRKEIQKVLSQINVETLALAIKGVDDDPEDRRPGS